MTTTGNSLRHGLHASCRSRVRGLTLISEGAAAVTQHRTWNPSGTATASRHGRLPSRTHARRPHARPTSTVDTLLTVRRFRRRRRVACP